MGCDELTTPDQFSHLQNVMRAGHRVRQPPISNLHADSGVASALARQFGSSGSLCSALKLFVDGVGAA